MGLSSWKAQLMIISIQQHDHIKLNQGGKIVGKTQLGDQRYNVNMIMDNPQRGSFLKISLGNIKR